MTQAEYDRKVHQAMYGCPKAGEPVYLKDGTWALVEKVVNEFHAGFDEFVDIVVLRGPDGNQSRVILRGFPIERDEFPNILCERSIP